MRIRQPKRLKLAQGFTLVELLIVISIIGVLSAMLTAAYRGALQESSNVKTRTTIQKISNVLIDCIEDYTMEPLGWSVPPRAVRSNLVAANVSRGDLIEQTKLLAIRDRLRMEMPDHQDDIKWTSQWVAGFGAPSTTGFDAKIVQVLEATAQEIDSGLDFGGSPIFAKTPPSPRSVRLMRKLSVLNSGGMFVPVVGWENTNANAELLYLIVEDAIFDGSSAIELFGTSEIGDTDGDGLKEFIDGFGRPIAWIRWPAGYLGASVTYPDPLDPSIRRGAGVSMRLAIEDESYDRSGKEIGRDSDSPAGPLGAPLVISGGSDRQFGIRLELDGIASSFENRGTVPGIGRSSRSTADVIWNRTGYGANPNIRSNNNSFRFADPWYPRNDPTQQLGSTLDAYQASDNISNLDGNAVSL